MALWGVYPMPVLEESPPLQLLAQQYKNAGDNCENGDHDVETRQAQNSQAHDADQDQVNCQQEHSDVLGDIHHLSFGFRKVAARLITRDW